MLAALALALLAVNHYVLGQSTAANGSSVGSVVSSIASSKASSPSSLSSEPSGTPSKDPSSLDFGSVHFAGHANYVYRDNVTAVQIVVTEYVFGSLRH